MADSWAKSREVEVIACPADWSRHGRAAGPIRNKAMLTDHAPELLVAFPGGRGTASDDLNRVMSRKLGKRFNNAKQEKGGDRKSKKSKAQNEPLIESVKTAGAIAAGQGVSQATVERARQLLEKLANAKRARPNAGRPENNSVQKIEPKYLKDTTALTDHGRR